MNSLREEIEAAMGGALERVVGPEGRDIDPVVRPTQDPKFGDYQSNVAMGLAKRLGKKPREVAEALVAALDADALLEPPEIAGPGFINLRIRTSYLAEALGGIQADPRLGIPPVERPRRVIVDFSSPNLAKEMHIGHLRTTVIGDTFARLLEFEGHDVLRLNHVGDWGTQFGMLLQYVRETQPDVLQDPERFRVADLESFYVAAKRRDEQDPVFAEAARRAVVDLQGGDPTARRLWEAFCHESLRHAHELYERLDVRLVDRGESFYNPMLPAVVEELTARGIAVESEGAICVFTDEHDVPLILRKTDGGYGYDTTDMAAVKQRVEEEKAQRIIYVTDLRQRQHFETLFAAARRAGWVPDSVVLEHVGYGMILGHDRRPFKTRDGNTVKLKDVLDEAETRALAAIAEDPERRGELTEAQKQEIARVVGIGAVKYADLSHNPSSDYVFDWDTMLALEGNTAPYMLYAYARVRAIGRKAGVDYGALPADLPLVLEHPSEIALAKQLLNFGGVLRQLSRELSPHHLTDYLYSLSRAFSTFYDRERGVRVADAAPETVRLSRLRLCDLTARTLKVGLGLLGIQVVEQM